ncbi:MAG: histidine phosphatase family protein [Bacteroidetes bacterium]|nr:histidine phosphatase family protein [Bacteroidota bacterium]MBS1980135.1 histidine phosphatase family protein [Bacteroidota bacterium]
MNIKRIYIVRHGQTDFNLQGIVQGSGVDSSLNETGLAQAKAFFDAYSHVQFDKIYTSKLKRTVESVARFIELGISHEAHAGLNEISWGSNEGQRITPEEDAYYHDMLKEWQNGNTSLKIKGGESPEEVALRQRPVIKQILHEPGENILVCMHGRAIRILLCQLLRYPLKSMDLFEHGNLCLYLVECTHTMSTIAKYNDVSHLVNVAQPQVQV